MKKYTMPDIGRTDRSERAHSIRYEITDIAHEKYPFLHRIRALQDIGSKVKAGDLGAYVEHMSNLSLEADDSAWIYDRAIAAGNAHVSYGAELHDQAVVCGDAFVTQGAKLFGQACVEDEAYVRGAVLAGSARASGQSMLLHDPNLGTAPRLEGCSAVYGVVAGNVRLTDGAVVLGGEELRNTTLDAWVIGKHSRTVLRNPARDKFNLHCRRAAKQPER